MSTAQLVVPAVMGFSLCVAVFSDKARRKILKQIPKCEVALKYLRRAASRLLLNVFAFENPPQRLGWGVRREQVGLFSIRLQGRKLLIWRVVVGGVSWTLPLDDICVRKGNCIPRWLVWVLSLLLGSCHRSSAHHWGNEGSRIPGQECWEVQDLGLQNSTLHEPSQVKTLRQA